MIRTSIVIPVHGRVVLTRQCLETLLATPLGPEVEIIAVDDASTDATPAVLAELADANPSLRIVTHETNTGFAVACNDGAAVATGELLVFLNNDTIPVEGWLDALVRHADAHPSAAAVGAKLLFPDGTIQHAGVSIGEDRNPHHVYAGFPGDHPAVNRSRPMQIVTAACMLVRRSAFEALGGFDPAYRNGHEDVDLCLRLGESGREVRYCHESVVVHLESVSRGRRSRQAAANGRLYRRRWAAKVQPDDVALYLADGLAGVAYGATYPVRLQVSPLLATVHDEPRHRATERLLRTRSQQVADLLGQVVGLTVDAAEGRLPADLTCRLMPVIPVADPEHDDELAEAVRHLQRVLAARHSSGPLPADTTTLTYRRLVNRIRQTVVETTPVGATVAVVSRGDDDLLDFTGRVGWHFPQDADGRWMGHHPAHSDAAVAGLVAMLRRGATHLVIPTPSMWWLDQYRAFGDHLNSVHGTPASTADCTVFALADAAPIEPSGR